MNLKSIFIEMLKMYFDNLCSLKTTRSLREKYTILYIEQSGFNQRITYKRLAYIWGVDVNSVGNIISLMKKDKLIKTIQKTDFNEDNNNGYLFIELLIHPTNTEEVC